MRTRTAVGSVLALLLLAGCGGNGSAPSAPAELQGTQAASLPVGGDIPAPRGHAILTLSGDVQHPNVGRDLELDLSTLDRMPQFESTVFEPFLKRDVRFSGVLLSDLFAYAGSEGASAVRMTALDDYRVSFGLAELEAGQILLATHADGERISVADGGPSRLVFLNADHGLGADTDNWIWSVDDMLFEAGS
jgi:hypothetical protein